MVTLAPLAANFPDAVPLVPFTTLPIARVVGETASCPAELEEFVFDEVEALALLTPWQELSRRGRLSKSSTPTHFCMYG